MTTDGPVNLEMYDRSRRFGDVVQAHGIGGLRLAIVIDKKIAASPTAQLIALAVCTIMPRISERYTSIDLCIPHQTVRIPRVKWKGPLADYLLAELAAICPWGQFRAVEQLSDVYDHCIVIGQEAPVTARHIVYAVASGWRCFVSEIGPHFQQLLAFNPSTCLATAALASMFVYRRAEHIEALVEQPEINGWSLLSYTESDDDGPALPLKLDLGEVRQAGVGGTGNALLWALRYGPELAGRWIAFEHEAADVTNWNRYLLLKYVDGLEGRAKAEVALNAFQGTHPQLKFGVLPQRVEHFYGEFVRAKMVLATVDDPKVRVELQPYSRNVLLNVGTNSQCLSMSVHSAAKIISGDACVGCLYGQNNQAERRQREATVSFVLALVGAALCGEFIKAYAFPEHLLSNSWLANIFYPASAKTALIPKVPQCSVCESLTKTMPAVDVLSQRKPVLHPGLHRPPASSAPGKGSQQEGENR
jgi:molybdopterin/thiamine biosynthesis adenylyltransferase